MWYNVKVKTFADGTQQFCYYEQGKQRDYEQGDREETGENIERKEIDNEKRAKGMIYDYARNNDFDWFITLTFSPVQVNRYDYNACAVLLKGFTDIMRHWGCSWLIVPDVHDDGAYHFHGLVRGELHVEEAINPYTHDRLLDGHGRQVYNIKGYKYGYSTATKITDKKRVSSYITKYMTKKLHIPKGKKRYWASRSLQLPKEEFFDMRSDEFGAIYNDSRYQTDSESPYGGRFIFCET